jgi:hypothetical protein
MLGAGNDAIISVIGVDGQGLDSDVGAPVVSGIMQVMTAHDRLTIDTTVVRDILESDRPRHADALRLDAMRKRGEIDFVIAAQGSRFDIPDDPVASRFPGEIARA